MIYFISKQEIINDSSIEYISIEESLLYLDELKWIYVDTETEGLDRFKHKILLLQLGNKENQFVIDTTTITILEYKELLEKKNLILQNAKFDLQFLYKIGIIPKGLIWDTMLAEKVLTNGLDLPSNLAHLCKMYCDITLNKSIRQNFTKKNYKIIYDDIVYGAEDIKYLGSIARQQAELAKKQGVLKAILLENRFVKVLAYIEYCGIYLDKEKWIKKYKSAGTILKEKEAALDKYVIENNYEKFIDKQLDLFTQYDDDGIPILDKTTINWSSTKQVIPLFKDIGIDVSADNKTGESIAANILEKQKCKFDIIPLYLEYQTIKKDFSTYGESFLKHINLATERIHPEFNQMMITSRLSCNKPNMQNLPSDDRTRSCFTAEEGNVLIDCDYKAQEDIIFVNNSKEPKMVEFYKMPNADGHSYVASLCFPKEIGDTPNHEIKKKFPELRQKAKAGKFAIHYSGTGYTIANNLNLTEDEGNAIENAYLSAFPAIANYLKQQKNLAIIRGYILISQITGRKVYPKDNIKNLTRKEQYEFSKLACNYPIQGQSAELTKEGMVLFFNWILENNYFNIVKITNAIHDEALVEAPIKLTEIVAKNLKDCLEEGAKPYCQIVPLTADVEISDHWVH